MSVGPAERLPLSPVAGKKHFRDLLALEEEQ